MDNIPLKQDCRLEAGKHDATKADWQSPQLLNLIWKGSMIGIEFCRIGKEDDRWRHH